MELAVTVIVITFIIWFLTRKGRKRGSKRVPLHLHFTRANPYGPEGIYGPKPPIPPRKPRTPAPRPETVYRPNPPAAAPRTWDFPPPSPPTTYSEKKGIEGEQKVADELNRLGRSALHNIILARGGDLLSQIDHVVKTEFGLFVLETKNYSGFIHGHVTKPKWTVVSRWDGKERKTEFPNPIWQNYGHEKAVRHVIEDSEIPITGYVVFVGDARIGSTVSNDVLDFRGLQFAFSHINAPLCKPQKIDAAWRRLEQAAKVNEPRRPEHLAQVRAAASRGLSN